MNSDEMDLRPRRLEWRLLWWHEMMSNCTYS